MWLYKKVVHHPSPNQTLCLISNTALLTSKMHISIVACQALAIAAATISSQLSPASALASQEHIKIAHASSQLEVKDTFHSRLLEDDHSGHDHGDEDHDDHSDSKPWGLVILSTLLINLVTLSGVAFVIPAYYKKIRHGEEISFEQKEDSKTLNIVVPAFASGALISTILFLVLPEAIMMVNNSIVAENKAAGYDPHAGHDHRFLEGDEDADADAAAGELEVGTIWRIGTCILAGFILHLFLGLLFNSTKKADSEDPEGEEQFESENVEDPKKNSEIDTDDDTFGSTSSPIDTTFCITIFVGDAFHNFCDGIFVGVAFMLCDNTTAWTITSVTLYHEIAQEIADFFMLTRHGGLSVKTALLLNFLAGLSVVLGGIVVLLVDVSDMTIGIILGFTSGVYFHIGGTECMARANSYIASNKDRLIALASFVLGSVPIGLTLLNHQHC